nr:hypothetical protein [Tanacetum cinerariifolium]
MMLERLSQPIADPLALLSNVSDKHHGSPSSSTSSFTKLPPPRADSSSPADDLIENLTSTLALLTQSYRTFLPQTNNQLRTYSNTRNQAIVQDGRVVVQNVQGRPNRGQGMNPQGGSAAGYGEAHNRVRNVNQGQARLGQARTVKCYNYNGTGHIARNCTQPKRPQNSEYFKDKMLLMQAQENGVALDAEQLLFLAEDCDAFDSDVDEAPTAQTMFMSNLSSADPITDKARPSYDSDILSEVQDHDQYLDDTCAYQEEHVMHDSVQLDHVVDLHADYTSVSKMIPYDQYVKDNEVPVVHSNASSVHNDTFMMIYNDMCKPSAPSVSNSSRNAVVKNFFTAELATYREQVELFVTTVKLNRGLRDSNYDQLFAYLKQYEAHAKENKMMLERLSQPIADPLALLSSVSDTHHGSPSSSTSSFTKLPPPRADSSSPADDLIENLTSTLALLTQSYRTFLPQTNNQLRTYSNTRNQAIVQDGRVVVQNVQRRPNRGQGMNPQGGSAAGYGEAHNRVGNVNQGQARLGQARTVKCYNYNGTCHIARNCTQPKRPHNSEYFKDKMLLMHAQENGVALDAEQLLFLVADPITDEARPSYDSDILSEVQDHDQYLDDTCAYQEEHVMHDSVQLDHVVDLHADYMSVSKMIPYD